MDDEKKKDSLRTLVEIKCREDIINLPDIATLRDLKSQWNIESDSPLQTREDYISLLLRVYDQSHERIQKVMTVNQSAVTIIPNIILSRVWCPLHLQQFKKKKKSTKWFFLLILINLHIIHGVSKLLIRMLLVNYALITIFFIDVWATCFNISFHGSLNLCIFCFVINWIGLVLCLCFKYLNPW